MFFGKIEVRTLTMQAMVALCLALAFCLSPGLAKGQNDNNSKNQTNGESTSQPPEEEERCRTRQDQLRCIKVYVNVLDTDTTKDVFGRRIGDRFVAIQVTITNRSSDFQYLIHDVSLDLWNIFVNHNDITMPRLKTERYAGEYKNKPEQQEYRYRLSSLELSVMRGVAEKGQGQDKRNLTLRLLRGLGTVAAGLIGVGVGGNTYPEGVAVFNGPFLSAYMDAFPDYTINQMNRLNDTAYRTNRLIPKQQAVVLVAFIPQKIFLDEKQRKVFKKDPLDLLYPSKYKGMAERAIDLRRIEAEVDGDWITEVGNLPLTTTTVVIDPAEMKKFQTDNPTISGYISGQSLTGAKIESLNQGPEVITVVKDENTSTDSRLFFKITATKPLPPRTPLNFRLSKNESSQTIASAVSYIPDAPTLNDITKHGKQGEPNMKITLKGTNFITNTPSNPRATWVITDSDEVQVVDVKVRSSTEMDVFFNFGASAPASTDVQVELVESGTIRSNSKPLTVDASGGTQ